MVTSLFQYEKINTTQARAKELRKVAERLITIAKRSLGSSDANSELSEVELTQKRLHALRQILKVVQDKEVAKKVLNIFAERYSDRPGGYTQILKLGLRSGDKASMSVIRLVDASSTEELETD
jgi:large subunit ribosomal protein L17